TQSGAYVRCCIGAWRRGLGGCRRHRFARRGDNGCLRLAREAVPPASTEPASPGTDAAPNVSAALGTAPIAVPDDASIPVERNADTHLAEIESILAPDERLVVHALFSDLSPDDRDAWLDKLLWASVADGAAMLRAAIQAATAEPDTAVTSHPGHERATATAGRAAATSDEGDEPDHSDLDGDDVGTGGALRGGAEPDSGDELGSGNELHDSDEGESSNEPAAHEQPTPAAASQKQPDAPQRPATPATPAIATITELPTHADALAHFQAIEDALTLAEKMRANELAAQRPAAELRRWYADLVQLSVPEAVEKIRAELARSDSDSSSKKGGAS
ncbi:MAG TPA: hypothetical protein VFD36_12370, partial [Kofleriaceae bacterium]|nr:hypothetical protein [Kofleriaceae bacterium]